MHLKRLEIRGFKSFADKIEIEFPRGITAIVGPNGSGKSNVTDAIRWVLGEQNIRNLRCTKAQDIIFAGSGLKNSLGLAEVSLTLVNEGDLAVDFAEVLLTRKLFRSGESEFYINSTKCRLKDIYDLLADTGLGQDGISVISQNKIDEILNSKPEERRLFFEETAGISKYKTKKNATFKKITDMEQNLTRIFDIMSEVRVHLEPLAKEKEKAEQYNKIARDYKCAKITLISHEYQANQKTLAEQHKNLQQLQIEEETRAKELEDIENSQGIFSKSLLDIENDLQEKNRVLTATKEALNKITGELLFLDEQIVQQNKRKEEIEADKIKVLDKEKDLHLAVQTLQGEILHSKQNIREFSEKLTFKRQEAKVLAEKIRQDEHAYGEIKTLKDRETQKLLLANKNLENIEVDFAREHEEREDIGFKLRTLQAEVEKLKLEKKELAENIYFLAQKNSEQKKVADLLSKDILGLTARLEAKREAFSTKKQHRQEILTRKNILEDLKDHYDGFGRAVKAVLGAKALWRASVVGAVAELISVDKKYVVALEVALGFSQQHLVVEDEETAKRAIEFLKSTNNGRATFLPLTSLQPSMRQYPLTLQDGFLGYANEIARVEPRLQKVLDFLLGKTLIFDTLDHGLLIAKKYGYKLRIVTLDGDILQAGGTLTGGSKNKRDSSYLERKLEIEGLREKEQDICQDIYALDKEISHLEANVQKLNTQKSNVDVEQRRNREQEKDLQNKLKILDVTLSLKENNLAELMQKAEHDTESVASIAEKKNNILETIAKIRHSLEAMDTRIAENKKHLDEERMVADSLAKDIHHLEIELARQREVLSQKETFSLLKDKEKRDIAQSLLSHEAKIKKLSRGNIELLESKGANESTKVRLQEQYEVEVEEVARVQKTKEDLLAKNEANIFRAKEESEHLQLIQKEIHKLELSINTLKNKVQYTVDFLREEYSLTVEEAQVYFLDLTKKELKERVSTLAKEIEALGSVNLRAIEEYDKLKMRHDFLEKQSNDLETAKKDLLKIVKDIDKIMTEQFQMEFLKIESYFKEIFVKLFGGGKAQLLFTDKEDILHAGIEIRVQLPHKKEQNLTALSGGQRALTVIALLLAFLKCKPAPFSVLDEIDAPLDEANISEFGKYLAEFSEKTQFIIVTHRKATMEIADVLYGVTVAQKGESKLLSVRLKEGSEG